MAVLIAGCQSVKYKDVGNIAFDPNLDTPSFEICNEDLIKEYYVRKSSDTPPNYKGEKRGLEAEILNAYSYNQNPNENGFITIRFLINCKGESGRFRMEQMDSNYQPKEFDTEITQQLMAIVIALNSWIPRSNGEQTFDFYQYLTFKIQNGQITKILP